MRHTAGTSSYLQFPETRMTIQGKDSGYVLVFKTDIVRDEELSAIAGWLNYHPHVIRWSVDRENIDHVLRIESEKNNAQEIIEIVKEAGYSCEELSY